MLSKASLSDTLQAKNIRPSHVLGHSVGEIAAAYCAGILSLLDAVAIVAVRSCHQHALAGEGKMAAVSLPAEKAIEFAQKNGLDGIELAVINTLASVTITGSAEDIKVYREIARKSHVSVHILDIDYPFHHSLIDRERSAFLAELPDYKPKASETTFVSSVTGEVLNGEMLDAGYWWKNVRDMVRFSDAVAVAMSEGCNLFMEISPRSILSSYLVENARQNGSVVAIVPTLTRPGRNDNPMPHIVAEAVAKGAAPWALEVGIPRSAGTSLPPLPFENQTLRAPETSDKVNLFGRGQSSEKYTLLGWRTDPKSASWKNHIDSNFFQTLPSTW